MGKAIKTEAPSQIELTDEHIRWFQEKRLPGDPWDLAEECLDWHRANGVKRVDWIATWRNWCRQNRRFQAQREGVTDKRKQDAHLTNEYIEANANPGESYEQARTRLQRSAVRR